MDSPGRPFIGIPCRSDGSMMYKGRHINAQNSSYIRAIIHAGGVPFLIPLEARDEVLRVLFERADGIFLTGGGDVAPEFFGETPILSLEDELVRQNCRPMLIKLMGSRAAKGGSLLLDEIDVLGPGQQAKLLRVIETGEYEAVGSNETQTVKARTIVASNFPLEILIERGQFRPDLYYRLSIP